MAFNDDLPLVRFAEKVLYVNRRKSFVAAYDCRIFMPLSDGGSITIDHTVYPLKRFDLFYLPPATPYRIQSGEVITLLVINFDFTRRNEEQRSLLALTAPSALDPDKICGDVPDAFQSPAHFKYAEPLHQRLLEIVKENALSDCRGERMASLLLAECLVMLERAQSKLTTKKEDEIADAALSFLEQHATEKNCEEALCRLLAYHPYYVNRIFKKRMGETLHSYVLRLRVRMAASLLRVGTHKNEEIAAMVGLPNPAHFAKTFRHYMGVTPSAYRKAPPAF